MTRDLSSHHPGVVKRATGLKVADRIPNDLGLAPMMDATDSAVRRTAQNCRLCYHRESPRYWHRLGSV